jgi:hypothetical protein
VLAALALDEWSDRPGSAGRSDADRTSLRGGLILVLVSLLALASVWLVAGEFGWPRDRALWVGFGLLLAVMTLVRPWWFWDSAKARWLRGRIGDDPTAGLYLVAAAMMVWLGLFTQWTFGRE